MFLYYWTNYWLLFSAPFFGISRTPFRFCREPGYYGGTDYSEAVYLYHIYTEFANNF